MIHLIVLRKLIAKASVAHGLIGHDVSFAVHIGANNRHNVLFPDALDVERTGCASALNEGKDSVLVASAALDLEALFAANVGFVNLDDPASAAHWGKRAIAHCFADTVSEEPSGFHAAREKALNLAGRNALLARTHKVDDLQPKVQRQVRTLEDGSLPNGELPLAFVATVKAKAARFTLHLMNALRVSVAAMRASRDMRPQRALDIRKSGDFVIEAGIVESGIGHGNLLWSKPTSWGLTLSSVTSPSLVVKI